ncbi:MAG: hypothetical protein M1546_27515 [Chloroflexi bacterium]|nr:hypothetical protein [Chloroflexota bacterium]
MNSFRRLFSGLSFVVIALLVTACTGEPTKLVQQEGDFAIALPRIVIEIDKDGVPAVAGISAEVLRTVSFNQFDPSILRMPTEYVDWLTRANLQHFEIVHKEDGLFLFANGKPLPHIGWSSESFANTGEVVNQLGVLNPAYGSMVKMALPFVQRIGVDVAFKFPLQEGATPIAFADPSSMMMLTAEQTETPVAMARVHIKYSDDGVPSIMNVSSRDLGQAIGYDLRMLELTPDMVNWIKGTGIQHITMHTTSDGVLLWVNDKLLPSVVWSDEYLKNSVDLFGQLYYTTDPNLLKALQVLMPALSKVDAEAVLRFPVAEGATPISVPKP